MARTPAKAADWAQQGVEGHQGDFNDSAALAAALQGVEGAFLMVPPLLAPAPGFPEAQAILTSFREALRQTPPPRRVLLSSIGSEQPSGLGLITATHLMEETLADLPFPTAFIRAGSFLENYLSALPSAASTGVHYSFYQPLDRPAPTIATADIGAEVASLLTGASWNGKRIVELGSPVRPSDLDSAMGEALGPAPSRSPPPSPRPSSQPSKA